MLTLALAVALLVATNPPPRATSLEPRVSTPEPRASSLEIIDRIMAVVGGQPITLSDVQAATVFGLVPPAPPATPDPLSYAVDRLIERVLIMTEVDRYQPPEPAPEAVAERLTAIQQKVGTPQAFDAALRNTGLTIDQVRRDIRDDLRMQTYLNQRFGTADPPTRARLEAEWVASLRRRTEITLLYLGK
jgi:hypothetical protein